MKGNRDVDKYIYGTGAWKIGDIEGRPAMKPAYDLGKKA
jgi:hypothetical protein